MSDQFRGGLAGPGPISATRLLGPNVSRRVEIGAPAAAPYTVVSLGERAERVPRVRTEWSDQVVAHGSPSFRWIDFPALTR